MSKRMLGVILTAVLGQLLLSGCATTDNANQQQSNFNASGTPSPLNTGANPWTNVNPQVQGQIQANRVP